jgi:signal peptide peptidase SppA
MATPESKLTVELDGDALAAAAASRAQQLPALPAVTSLFRPDTDPRAWMRGAVWAFDMERLDALVPLARSAWGDDDDETFDPRTSAPLVVVPLHGFLMRKASGLAALFGARGLVDFQATLGAIAQAPNVKHVVLDIDSGGGSVYGVHETWAAVRALSQVKQVTAVISGLAASGGYWIASAASRLVITPSGEAGSIGVFGVHADWSGFWADKGVRHTIVSAGRFKTEATDLAPLSKDAQAAMQRRVDAHYAQFIGDVAAARNVSTDTVRAGFGEGRVLAATDAQAAGMVDAISSLDATLGAITDTLTDQARRSELQRLRSV